jgi:2-oxoglutarate ferredoxin oxidoreductase subunit beta
MIQRAIEIQLEGRGFSFVEILTMCPTGWFIETQEAPDYLEQNLSTVHATGVLKDLGSDDSRRASRRPEDGNAQDNGPAGW